MFCDVVGLKIGGRAYLKTFSHYLRMRGRDQFYLDSKNLSLSLHPTSWLRVHFLEIQARSIRLEEEAKIIVNEWNKIAEVLGLQEEHHGYYHSSFSGIIQETLAAMFAQIKLFSLENNVVELTNIAWEKYSTTIDKYGRWEENSITQILHN